MARASKRTKTATTSTVSPDDADSGSASTQAQTQLFIPFQTGSCLEHIPDDVLHEVLSHLPTLTEAHVLFGCHTTPPVIPSTSLVRTPTLRALSQTSQLLRSRCLVMAWQGIELCGASIPKHNVSYYKVIGEATKAAIRVLKACPHLRPLIRTVTIVLTRFQSAEIVPAFAACLASLPNLTTIQVVHAHPKMTTAIKNGFEGKKLPSVQRILLPSSAHEIIKSCPNLEEVTCVDGNGSTILGSLIKGNCQQVHTLKDIHVPLIRLVDLLPNLKHVRVEMEDMLLLTIFRLLDTIEIDVSSSSRQDLRLSEYAASYVKQASEILKENKSKAKKTVLLTNWENVWNHHPMEFDISRIYMTREAIDV